MQEVFIDTIGLAQLGKENYLTKAHFEIAYMKDVIKQLFKELPEGMKFITKENPHDFGTYLSLNCKYDEENQKHLRFADKLESIDWEDYEVELSILWENVSKIRDGLKDYHTADENVRRAHDYFNQFPGKLVKKTEDEQPRELSAEEVAESHGMEYEEMIESYMFSSVVPACCEAGCEVEPDGTCQHGHESILLAMGLV